MDKKTVSNWKSTVSGMLQSASQDVFTRLTGVENEKTKPANLTLQKFPTIPAKSIQMLIDSFTFPTLAIIGISENS
jgi:hypothetical protein